MGCSIRDNDRFCEITEVHATLSYQKRQKREGDTNFKIIFFTYQPLLSLFFVTKSLTAIILKFHKASTNFYMRIVASAFVDNGALCSAFANALCQK
jgi:hypothetical protein